jgi:hypothetical protein
MDKLVGLGFPEGWQARFRQFVEYRCEFLLRQDVDNHDALTFLFIRHRSYCKRLLGDVGKLVQSFFDADVRDHLSADLAEARETVSNGEESIFVHHGNVSRGVPTVVKH